MLVRSYFLEVRTKKLVAIRKANKKVSAAAESPVLPTKAGLAVKDNASRAHIEPCPFRTHVHPLGSERT